MTKEIWKDIPDYEGYYQVSNLGRVRSLRKNIIMKQSTTKLGYKQIILSKSAFRKSYLVHRLVLITFIPNNNLLQVNHIDGVKINNKINNLQWCTKSENQKHAYDMNLNSNKGKKNPRAKLKEKDIISIRKLWNKGMNQKLIGKHFSISNKTVSQIVTRKSWSHIQ